MDLATYDIEKKSTRPLQVRGPDGRVLIDETSKEPVTILLLSADTREARNKQHELAERKVSETQNTGRRLDMSRIEADGIAYLAALTKGWEHVVVDGAAVPFSTEAAVALYTRFAFVKEQVDAFVSNRLNFLGN